ALATYDPAQWRTRTHDGARPFERLVLVGGDEGARASAERATRVAAWVNRARDLSNAPPNELTPEQLAERARAYAEDAGSVTVDALDRAQITELGMGSFAAVAQGAHNEPRLIVMR